MHNEQKIKKYRKKNNFKLEKQAKKQIHRRKMMKIVIRIWQRKAENGESGGGKEHKRNIEYHNEENLKWTNENE